MTTSSPVPCDYATLESLYKDLQKEFEELEQAIHSSSQQLTVKKALLCEYQHEIETLQCNIKKNGNKFESQILSVEETVNNTRMVQSQEITALESQLLQKDASINEMKNEIELMRRKKKMELDYHASPGYNLDDLSAENESLKESYAKLQEELQLLHNQHSEVLEDLEENQKLLSELTESVELRKVELQEKENLIGMLSAELCVANEKLKVYDNMPLPEGSKGNSLFAQVDDRRIHLQETVEKMKFNYAHLQQNLRKHEIIISDLHKKNCKLRKAWGHDLHKNQDTFKVAVESLTEELKLLEDAFNKLQLQLAEKVENNCYSKEDQFYHGIINGKRIEIRELDEKLAGQSKKVCDLSVTLADSKREMRLLNFNAIELQQQIEESKEKALLSIETEICRRYTMFKVKD